MEKQQSKSLQNFDEPKSEILKKRLLKSINTSVGNNSRQNGSQNNALLNSLRAPTSSSMIVSSMQAPQNSMSITHNLVTQSITPVKLHATSAPYPLQLSTVHVPVQIPGSTSNINVPVQLSGSTTTVPLQIAPVSLPLQVSGSTSVPVQLSAGETINVPLQIPTAGQNIQLTNATLPSMPLLQGPSQPLHSSIIHVHMGSNPRPTNLDSAQELTVSNASQLQISDSSGVQVKMNNPTNMSQVQVGSSPTVVQIPSTSTNSIQLRGPGRSMPHVVYIQTPTGLKPVTSTEVISQASTSGNPPQIIVRRPVTSNSNLHLLSSVSTKPNIAPKIPVHKSSILAPVNTSQPIVIQKPKVNEKVMMPVSIAPGAPAKQTIAYLGSVKKSNTKNISENQSILISNNQTNNPNNKLFLTPMNMPKIQNTKFILPVPLPTTMSSKGPIINLQIANGQIQNDPQGNITVMRDTMAVDTSEMPPLQPLGKANYNGTDGVLQSPKLDKPFTISISGSRAEPTGEQGEYTLSIPETNASMNDDIYTVSIEDDEGGHATEKSFTLAIPEKGKSLLNRNVIDRNDVPQVVAAPAILRRSNSDNSERKNVNANLKRRISLCTENIGNKTMRHFTLNDQRVGKLDDQETESNDDHRVPSLFCDEKLDKDLEVKNSGDSDGEEYKDRKPEVASETNTNDVSYSGNKDEYDKINARVKAESDTSEEDPPGLVWNNGVAALKGSVLQFQTNEFGLIDLVDNADTEELILRNSKYHTPLKQRIDRNRNKKHTSPEDLYRCDGCGCHGMAAEFITPNFCSSTCQTEVQKALLKQREREKTELLKKRNKIKKLLMKKQLSESDARAPDKDDKVLKHYDSAPTESAPDVASIKPAEDLGENEKYPWMCGKNGFSWMRYLDVCKAKAAPVKLFKNPFPYARNGFRVGMRLEAIDPQHPALFCVVSVAEVQGYRMRLHFDEYPDMYDYWVNADSADIFPPGWCEKNGRALQPPGAHAAAFSWPAYLKRVRAVAAPRQLFPHVTATVLKQNCFRLGMKLEADDRKNDLICVATIADMIDNRLRINFDSWDEMYDYWVEPNSPYIHPVGWAEENGLTLTPPNFYKDPDAFSWENYLSETNSTAAPPRAFKTRLPQVFKQGMKLEVVDKRVPFLIRVATISAVKGHQVRVTFDGWPDELSYWLDDDSPDLHPVGWCLKTGHPLEPPLTAEELQATGPCGVGGCRGLGSGRGGAHKQHAAPAACPYRAPRPPPDRLAAAARPPRERRSRGRPPKHKRVEEVSKNDASDEESISSGGGKRWRGASPARARTYSHASAPSPGPASPPHVSPPHMSPPQVTPPPVSPPRDESPPRRAAPKQRLALNQHIAELALSPDPKHWTQEEVSALVSRVAGACAGAAVAAARLAGAELLMCSREELVCVARLRLGPAVKLYACVRHLRDTLS